MCAKKNGDIGSVKKILGNADPMIRFKNVLFSRGGGKHSNICRKIRK